MREMVLAKKYLRCGHVQFLLNEMLDPQLVTEPTDHSFAKYPVGLRKSLHRRKKQALEFDKRLLEKNHVIEIRAGDSAYLQAEVDCVLGKLVVVFLARESLFLRRRYKLAVAEQRGGRVVK